MKKFLLALLMLSPAVARAEQSALPTRVYEYGALFSQVALNAAAGSRTATLPVSGMAKMLIQLDYTWAAASTVVITETCNLDGSASIFASPTSSSTVSGARTLYPIVTTRPVSATENFIVEFDVRGMKKCKYIISGASGGSSDLFDAIFTGVVGQ